MTGFETCGAKAPVFLLFQKKFLFGARVAKSTKKVANVEGCAIVVGILLKCIVRMIKTNINDYCQCKVLNENTLHLQQKDNKTKMNLSITVVFANGDKESEMFTKPTVAMIKERIAANESYQKKHVVVSTKDNYNLPSNMVLTSHISQLFVEIDTARITKAIVCMFSRAIPFNGTVTYTGEVEMVKGAQVPREGSLVFIPTNSTCTMCIDIINHDVVEQVVEHYFHYYIQ